MGEMLHTIDRRNINIANHQRTNMANHICCMYTCVEMYTFNLCVGKIYKPQTERTNKWLITAVNNVVLKKVIKKRMYTLEIFSFTPDLPLETMLINRKNI